MIAIVVFFITDKTFLFQIFNQSHLKKSLSGKDPRYVTENKLCKLSKNHFYICENLIKRDELHLF